MAHLASLAVVDDELRLVQDGYPWSNRINWQDGNIQIASMLGVDEAEVAALRKQVKEGKAKAPLPCPPAKHEIEIYSTRHGEVFEGTEVVNMVAEAGIEVVGDDDPLPRTQRKNKGK